MSSVSTLFVYGTLRPRFEHPMARLLESQATWLDEARAPGRLYDLGSYPGMYLGESDGDWVCGDLYELHRPDVMLPQLDDYEGCGPPESLYKRVVMVVVMSSGQRCPAWVYLYEKSVHESQRIWSGDYCRERSKES